jgi:hypothetical protein
MEIRFEGIAALGRQSVYSSIIIANRPIGYVGQDRQDLAYVAIYEGHDSHKPAFVKLFKGREAKAIARSWLTNLFEKCRLANGDLTQLSPIALFNEAARQAGAAL